MFLHSELCTSQLWGHLERLKELGILEVCQNWFFDLLQMHNFEFFSRSIWGNFALEEGQSRMKKRFCSLQLREKDLLVFIFAPPLLHILRGGGAKMLRWGGGAKKLLLAKIFYDLATLGKILKPRLPILSNVNSRISPPPPWIVIAPLPLRSPLFGEGAKITRFGVFPRLFTNMYYVHCTVYTYLFFIKHLNLFTRMRE